MRLEIGQIFTQIISFLVMLWVLRRYAWKPLLEILNKRQQKIKSEFEAIDLKKKEIEKKNAEYANRLKEIDKIAFTKTQEAIDKGKQGADEIQKQAQKQAKEIINKAQKDLEKEVAKAKVQLKNEMVKMTIEATEKILEKNIDNEKEKKIINEFIDKQLAQN